MLSALVLTAFGPETASAQNIRIPNDCRDVIATDVQVSLRTEGRSEMQMKALLRNLAALEAVQKISGVMVRSKSEMAMSSERTSERASIDARFQQKIRAQAGGLVSLSVTEESIIADQAVLKAAAKVCIPKEGALKEPVYIQTFVSSRGAELAEGKEIMESTFSSSRSFVPVADPADGDWRIEGRIESVDVRKLEAGESSSSNPLLQLGNDQARDMQRFHIKGFVQATNSEGDKLVQWFDEFRNFNASRDANDFLEIWTPQVIRTATQNLQERLLQKIGAASAKGDAPSPSAQNPKW